MEKRIMYTEVAPDKKFLWLHTKNDNLVLEVFGNRGWESVGDDSEPIPAAPEPLKVKIPELDEHSTKKDVIKAFNTLKKVLVKANIIAE